MKSKIFVVTHKKIDMNLPINYQIIQVGSNKKIGENYILDNSGNNISNKNKNYCELTAIYWLWKNYELPEYIGICHYRRYFVKGCIKKLIDEHTINKIMKKYDVILPKKFYFKLSVWETYFKSGYGKEKDLIALKKIISEEHTDYIKEFEDIMKAKNASYCNMFIISKDKYCDYCEWLFSILSRLEEEIDLSNYTKEEARIYGYLSEILLNVWIKHNSLKVKRCKVLKIDDTLITRLKFQIKNTIKRIVYK